MDKQFKADLSIALMKHGIMNQPELETEICSVLESYSQKNLKSFIEILEKTYSKSNCQQDIKELISQSMTIHSLMSR